MKQLILILALAVFSSGFAQVNTNKKKETVVTKTAVKDNKGTEVSSKAVSISEQQKLKLQAANPNQTNQEVVMSPMEVDTDVTYGYEGNRFKFLSQKDEEGYRLMNVRDNATQEEYAIIKPTSQNGYYIYSQKGKTSFGYFNEDGNFVVESYDPQAKAVVSQIYKLQTQDGKQ